MFVCIFTPVIHIKNRTMHLNSVFFPCENLNSVVILLLYICWLDDNETSNEYFHFIAKEDCWSLMCLYFCSLHFHPFIFNMFLCKYHFDLIIHCTNIQHPLLLSFILIWIVFCCIISYTINSFFLFRYYKQFFKYYRCHIVLLIIFFQMVQQSRKNKGFTNLNLTTLNLSKSHSVWDNSNYITFKIHEIH